MAWDLIVWRLFGAFFLFLPSLYSFPYSYLYRTALTNKPSFPRPYDLKRMYSKFTLLALLPFAAALTVEPLSNTNSQSEVTVKWQVTSPDDPAVFTIELRNDAFNDAFAIANAVDASLLELTLTLPVVPDAAGYTIQLVDVGDINTVYAESGEFAIGAVSTDSTTGTSSTSSGTRSSTSASTTTRATTSRPAVTTTSSSASSTATSEGSTFNGASPMRYSMTGALLAAVAGVAVVAL
jgi:hypothetical protein